YRYCDHCAHTSFPTRRSSDLGGACPGRSTKRPGRGRGRRPWPGRGLSCGPADEGQELTFVQHGDAEPLRVVGLGARILTHHHVIDRKSTRLNSSHVSSSYAVF